MENQFAKLFTFETGQLLVMKDYDETNELTKIVTRSDRDGITIQSTATLLTADDCTIEFSEYDQTKADKVFGGMQSMLRK